MNQESGSTRISRLHMLKRTAAGAAAFPLAVRASALGRGEATAPSERITLGFIGIGRMGQGHLGLSLRYPDVQRNDERVCVCSKLTCTKQTIRRSDP